jgi:hypothetical protein
VTYLETFNSSTNLYDCALMESVMDALDFGYAKDVKWKCIQYAFPFFSCGSV